MVFLETNWLLRVERRCSICGIAGYIGTSNDPSLTHKIISNLLLNLEIRGKDATGFWGANKNNKILYHKEPTRSSLFINKPIWKNIEHLNPNILLCHAREASSAYGLPMNNKNNHPFVNDDLSVGLIHNGKIPPNLYKNIKTKYKTFSNCDSEIFLRVFQSKRNNSDIESTIKAINYIWSLLNESFMSVAVGEIIGEKRRLWLFRNEHRPNYCVEVISLGQLFFVSTPDIWYKSIENIKVNYEVSEIPVGEIWLLDSYLNVEKYPASSDISCELDESFEFNYLNINENIYTNLDSNEEPKDLYHNRIEEIKSICSDILINIEEIEGSLELDLNFNGDVIDNLNFANNYILGILKNIKNKLC